MAEAATKINACDAILGIFALFLGFLWAACFTALIVPFMDVISSLEGAELIAGIFFLVIQDGVALAAGYFLLETILEGKTIFLPHDKIPEIDTLAYEKDLRKEGDGDFYTDFGTRGADEISEHERKRKRATKELLVELQGVVLTSERLKLIERWAINQSRRTIVSKGEVDEILRLFPSDALVEAYIYEVMRPFLAKLLQKHRREDALVNGDPNFQDAGGTKSKRHRGDKKHSKGDQAKAAVAELLDSEVDTIRLVEDDVSAV